ncbi:uncharacterized protein AMSG_01813 [Thecamonas trahens ATCC 50062]|uniref:Uncharacterized protein n=1 Tax=Thecamonas trahens ATCC 50062 TaxID=461836 RepID=A0A0L0DTG1_THETB|nr:hypothetical protein AMSG_01813 [Thecamonas trahens ATCC 50062]KNC55550.1 hypothetical protein AMSG_01813 [Thecamonas trahens ATCC 50062]|eukprot:XP_013761324.1 hypothetical protein AMSG_01813 [Thecamonas trahens ATCC 50062]
MVVVVLAAVWQPRAHTASRMAAALATWTGAVRGAQYIGVAQRLAPDAVGRIGGSVPGFQALIAGVMLQPHVLWEHRSECPDAAGWPPPPVWVEHLGMTLMPMVGAYLVGRIGTAIVAACAGSRPRTFGAPRGAAALFRGLLALGDIFLLPLTLNAADAVHCSNGLAGGASLRFPSLWCSLRLAGRQLSGPGDMSSGQGQYLTIVVSSGVALVVLLISLPLYHTFHIAVWSRLNSQLDGRLIGRGASRAWGHAALAAVGLLSLAAVAAVRPYKRRRETAVSIINSLLMAALMVAAIGAHDGSSVARLTRTSQASYGAVVQCAVALQIGVSIIGTVAAVIETTTLKCQRAPSTQRAALGVDIFGGDEPSSVWASEGSGPESDWLSDAPGVLQPATPVALLRQRAKLKTASPASPARHRPQFATPLMSELEQALAARRTLSRADREASARYFSPLSPPLSAVARMVARALRTGDSRSASGSMHTPAPILSRPAPPHFSDESGELEAWDGSDESGGYTSSTVLLSV